VPSAPLLPPARVLGARAAAPEHTPRRRRKKGNVGVGDWHVRLRVEYACGGLSYALGIARCGRSACCVLCVLWAMSAAVLGGGGG